MGSDKSYIATAYQVSVSANKSYIATAYQVSVSANKKGHGNNQSPRNTEIFSYCNSRKVLLQQYSAPPPPNSFIKITS
jgi:hypothetical protein